MTKKVYL